METVIVAALSWVPVVVAATLLASAIMKAVLLARDELDWPELRLPGRYVVPAGAVVAGEGAAVSIATAMEQPAVAAAVLAVVFLCLTGGSVALLGRRCACFGTSAKVGAMHVASSAATMIVLSVVVVIRPPQSASLSARLALVFGLGAVLVAVLLLRRNTQTRPTEQPVELSTAVSALIIVFSESCNACARLRSRLRDYPEAWITWQRAGIAKGDDPWAEVAGMRYPCAVPVDAAGQTRGEPQWGVAAIVALADQLAVRHIAAGS